MLGNMVLAVALQNGQHVSSASLNGNPISAYFEEAGFGYIYLPKLDREVYEFTYEVGSQRMPRFVNNMGTYNVYNVTDSSNRFTFEVQMYGTQTIEVVTNRPRNVESDNEFLSVLSHEYDTANGVLHIEVHGRDIQGETGIITLNY